MHKLLILIRSSWREGQLLLRYSAIFSVLVTAGDGVYSQGVLTEDSVVGEIVDQSNDPIPFVTVRSGVWGIPTHTDERGMFELRADTDTLFVSSTFYQDTVVILAGAGARKVRITLLGSELALAEVSATRPERPGAFVLRRPQMEALPALGGEVDVLRSLQSLPGVGGTNEGSASVSIRGGDPSHSLVLLDGVPIFAPAVFFGYQGAINYEVVRDVTVFTAGLPARYGGRLSGVVDIHTRRGNTDSHRRQAAIGFPSVGVTLDGPGRDANASYLFTARASYLGGLSALSGGRFLQGDFFGRYDFGQKWLKTFTVYGNVSAIGTSSSEEDLSTDLSGYYNLVGTYRATKTWHGGDLTVSGGYTRYTTLLNTRLQEGPNERFAVQSQRSGINRLFARSTWSKRSIGNWGGILGVETAISAYPFRGVGKVDSAGVIRSELKISQSNLTAEILPFIELDYTITPSLIARVGLRAGALLSSTLGYEVIFEPRLNIEYVYKATTVLSMTYDRTRQTVHALDAPNAAGTFDRYLPPTKAYGSPVANQLGLSARWTPAARHLQSIGIGSFAREMRALVVPRFGDLGVSTDLESATAEVVVGHGVAYGAEGSIELNYGILAFRSAYTWTRSLRQYDRLNAGRPFAYQWQRPHRLNVLSRLAPTKSRWTFSANFVFETGYSYSYPDAYGTVFTPGIGPQRTLWYGKLNERRAPSHHRLDLAANYKKSMSSNRQIEWRFSLYNAYGRNNPSAIIIALVDDFTVDPVTNRLIYKDSSIDLSTRTIFRFIPGVQFRYTW